MYRADKIVDPSGPYAICPACGYRHTFRQLPLLMVSGASGSGKSTVCNNLLGRLDDVVLLDSDILWRPEFNQPETNFRDFFETWLRMAKNISQAGRPVVLFGAGLGVPGNIEPCIERRYFSQIHYLALVCDEGELARRLQARPAWRGSGEPAFIDSQIRFNRWFKETKDSPSPISLLETTGAFLERSVEEVHSWIRVKAGI